MYSQIENLVFELRYYWGMGYAEISNEVARRTRQRLPMHKVRQILLEVILKEQA